MCEEFLFRGYMFTALRNWRGTWPAAVITGLIFGVVHVGSAPALDLVPLAGLGFGLCLLYRYSGSLYPCFAAHSLNNCIAFASLEGWHWDRWLPLIAGSLAGITGVVMLFKRLGLIADRVEDRSLSNGHALTMEGPPLHEQQARSPARDDARVDGHALARHAGDAARRGSAPGGRRGGVHRRNPGLRGRRPPPRPRARPPRPSRRRRAST